MQETKSQQSPGIKLWFLCFRLIMSNMSLYGCVGRATQCVGAFQPSISHGGLLTDENQYLMQEKQSGIWCMHVHLTEPINRLQHSNCLIKEVEK